MVAEEKLPENPVREFVAAISCGICDGAVVLDLDYAEDSSAQADTNFVLTESGKIVEIQGTAEGQPVCGINAFGAEGDWRIDCKTKRSFGSLVI